MKIGNYTIEVVPDPDERYFRYYISGIALERTRLWFPGVSLPSMRRATDAELKAAANSFIKRIY